MAEGISMNVRRVAAALIAAFAWTACSVAAPVTAPSIEMGRDFSLRVGESAQTRDGMVRVGFEGVTADSRCPKGEQCIRAGDATVRVSLSYSDGRKEARDLRQTPAAPSSLRILDHFVRLVRLDPYPVSGKATAKSDYVVTLRLSDKSEDAPDR